MNNWTEHDENSYLEPDKIEWAKELMEEYPEYVQGLSLREVMTKWFDYSDSMSAQWMIPRPHSVEEVFGGKDA